MEKPGFKHKLSCKAAFGIAYCVALCVGLVTGHLPPRESPSCPLGLDPSLCCCISLYPNVPRPGFCQALIRLPRTNIALQPPVWVSVFVWLLEKGPSRCGLRRARRCRSLVGAGDFASCRPWKSGSLPCGQSWLTTTTTSMFLPEKMRTWRADTFLSGHDLRATSVGQN